LKKEKGYNFFNPFNLPICGRSSSNLLSSLISEQDWIDSLSGQPMVDQTE